MSVSKPFDLMTDLITDTEFLTPVFIASVLKRVMPFSRACASQNLLFDIPVFRVDGPGSRDADVVIFLASHKALERLNANFHNELVHFIPDEPKLEIYGFVRSYAAISIQLHRRLGCLYVQLS